MGVLASIGGGFCWERNAVEEGWDGMSGEAGVEWWNGMHDFRGCGCGRCGWGNEVVFGQEGCGLRLGCT